MSIRVVSLVLLMAISAPAMAIIDVCRYGAGHFVSLSYTTDLTIKQQMIARGYIAEGFGPEGVAMCAVAP